MTGERLHAVGVALRTFRQPRAKTALIVNIARGMFDDG